MQIVKYYFTFDTVSDICGKNANEAHLIRERRLATPNRSIRVGKATIGEGHPAFIIAEAGLNHNGSVDIAKRLIEEAVQAGCSAIKFQTFNKGSRVSSKVKGARYAEKSDGLEIDIAEMFDSLAMSHNDQRKVLDYGRSCGIEVFSTPFDKESVDFLESAGVKLYKIASMDLINIPLIEYVAETMKPIILSTGMSRLSDIEDALDTILRCGNPNVILLHCNSSYPAAESEMNLNAINTLKHAFKTAVGLSDHTLGLFASQTALAIGANLIERHFTLSRTMEGPDHILSSEPDEIKRLVIMAKRIPEILGDGIKRIQPNEYSTLNAQRKCLYAASFIKQGETISQDKLLIKGPSGGILPKHLSIVTGRVAIHDIEADTPITWEDI